MYGLEHFYLYDLKNVNFCFQSKETYGIQISNYL